MSTVLDETLAKRLVIELLRLTRNSETTSVDSLVGRTRCSRQYAIRVLSKLDLLPDDDGRIAPSSSKRLDLAFGTASKGPLVEVGKFLSWQEFERFGERCLEESGYRTERNVRMKGHGRRWQVDLVGLRESLLLSIDCKHWATPSSPSRFKSAAEHQAKATRLLVEKTGNTEHAPTVALPIILTLFDPPEVSSREVVVLPIQKFASMLAELTPYSPGLPFIVANQQSTQNPISKVFS